MPYAALAYVGHLSALAYIPLLLLVPVMILIPQPWIVMPLAVFMSSVGLSFLLLDSMVFAENRYHLGFLTFSLLETKTWGFSSSTSFWAWPWNPWWQAGSGDAPRCPRRVGSDGILPWASERACWSAT